MSQSFPKWLVAFLFGMALLVPRAAAADTTTTVGALSWTTDFSYYFEYYDSDQNSWIQMNATQLQYFFNRARCECNGDTTKYTGYFRIAIQPAANTADKIRALLNQNLVTSGTARLIAGSEVLDCLNPTSTAFGDTYNQNCLNLINPGDPQSSIEGGMATFAATKVWRSSPIPVAWLFNAANNPVCSGTGCDSTASCAKATSSVIIYFWANTSSGQKPDMGDATMKVNLVGQSSFIPDNVQAEGGNEAITVSWSWPNGLSPSGNAAFMGVQIFCVRGQSYQVFESKSFDPAFMTSTTLCREQVPATTQGIDALDPDFLCSGLLPSTSTSHRITGLQNGIPYGVGVAAIDKYGNASLITDLVYASPIPTVDFYTQYKNDGGAAQGGYCAVAKTSRSPGALALAGLGVLGLLGWRVRRKRRGPGGAVLVALLAGSMFGGVAQAQSAYQDDMIVHDKQNRVWPGTPRQFAIEARFGLYTPAVDSEFSGTDANPQTFIFGTKRRPMWQLEFDWEFLQVFGTLSVGGVVGYYKENAEACILSTLERTGECERSGDNTSLRLIPLAALLVYRFDVLATHWRIPLVPYAKAGLNYTLWKITDGNGNVPSTPGGGRGAGGTAGWQSAVGISLLLDFLDPSAARGFDADAGVNHTYAFFELAHIDSSGLGGKNKLHVGDSTWFAGLMFEF